VLRKNKVVELKPFFAMGCWIKGNELIAMGNMRDGFLQRTAQLKDVTHG
jgi:hypothetical protein